MRCKHEHMRSAAGGAKGAAAKGRKVFARLFAPREAKGTKVFARLFQKAAGYKGSALGRAPQSAEFSMAFLFAKLFLCACFSKEKAACDNVVTSRLHKTDKN